MNIDYSREYLLVQASFLRKQLDRLPRVYSGVKCNVSVVRAYYKDKDGKQRRRDYKLDSEKGRKLVQLSQKREQTEKALNDVVYKLEKKNSCADIIQVREVIESSMNGEFFNKLHAQSNPKPIKKKYIHKGIDLRSRGEMMVAECLDLLGLPYKYEPALQFGDEVFYPDFIVYIEALDCCIIIEFLGMTDDYEYVMDLVGKIAKYARHDVFINRDLLLIAGTVDYMPSSDYIKGCIITLLNNLAATLVEVDA